MRWYCTSSCLKLQSLSYKTQVETWVSLSFKINLSSLSFKISTKYWVRSGVTWACGKYCHQIFSSVQFSRVQLWIAAPHESQHARPPCSSPTPGVHSDSCPSSRSCHPDISSSVVPFSSCPQSLSASGSFPMSQLFAWGGQSIGVSASASVLLMNTQDWSLLGWTGWLSLQSKGFSRVFSNTTFQKRQFFGPQLSLQSNSHIHTNIRYPLILKLSSSKVINFPLAFDNPHKPRLVENVSSLPFSVDTCVDVNQFLTTWKTLLSPFYLFVCFLVFLSFLPLSISLSCCREGNGGTIVFIWVK